MYLPRRCYGSSREDQKGNVPSSYTTQNGYIPYGNDMGKLILKGGSRKSADSQISYKGDASTMTFSEGDGINIALFEGTWHVLKSRSYDVTVNKQYPEKG